MKLASDLYAYPWTQPSANNCNCYLKSSAPAMMVDPGHAHLYKHVETGMAQDRLRPDLALVVLTHCHPDHMEAALGLQKAGAKLAMSLEEYDYMLGEGRQLAAALGMNFPDITPDIYLDEGEMDLGGEIFEIFKTPGHSPGHICIHWPRHKALFAGDLIFAQGVGRVDFPGGDGQMLKQSITRMSELDLDWVLPGHGPMLKGTDSIQRNFQLIEQMYFGML